MNARNAMRARTMFPHGGACIHVPWPWPRYVKDERYMRPQTPILYKRVILYTPNRSRPVRGAGGVLASDFYRQILSSTWASVVPAGTVPKDTAHHCVGRDTAPGISLLMEWWTIHHRGALQSLARDARRSHRSVEGDEKPHKMRERHRQTATKPRYYIRGIEITAQTGLGRIGAGVASSATSSTIIMSSTWASVVPAGTVPKDYPRHFDGLSGRPRASVSRRSPRSRAHRGHRAGFVEVGSGGDQGQHIEVSAGHAHQLQGLGLGRTLQKIVGGIVGRRLELGANTYRVLVHPTPPRGP